MITSLKLHAQPVLATIHLLIFSHSEELNYAKAKFDSFARQEGRLFW